MGSIVGSVAAGYLNDVLYNDSSSSQSTQDKSCVSDLVQSSSASSSLSDNDLRCSSMMEETQKDSEAFSDWKIVELTKKNKELENKVKELEERMNTMSNTFNMD